MGTDPTLARVLYLEKVINNTVLPYIDMSNDKKNKNRGAGSNGQAPPVHPKGGTDPAQAGSGSSTSRPWALKLPRYKVPTEYGLKLVTAEALDADPELLAYMQEHHPDCFVYVDSPADTPDEDPENTSGTETPE